MEYRKLRSDHHLVVQWVATPTVAAVEALKHDVEATRRAAGVPLVLLIVIPANEVDLPPPEVRRAFQATTRQAFELCAAVHVALLGDGVRVSLMRTGLRAMTLVARIGQQVMIHDSMESAARAAALPAPMLARLSGTP